MNSRPSAGVGGRQEVADPNGAGPTTGPSGVPAGTSCRTTWAQFRCRGTGPTKACFASSTQDPAGDDVRLQVGADQKAEPPHVGDLQAATRSPDPRFLWGNATRAFLHVTALVDPTLQHNNRAEVLVDGPGIIVRPVRTRETSSPSLATTLPEVRVRRPCECDHPPRPRSDNASTDRADALQGHPDKAFGVSATAQPPARAMLAW